MNITDARPTPYFSKPPYHVEHFPKSGWACVCNEAGFNCLSFASLPGAKFTTLDVATAICADWNERGVTA